MKKSTFFNSAKFLFFFFFLTQVCVAQLSNFTLAVTRTNETCTANGSLSFTTSGTTSGATMVYSIYLLPNTTTPIATISGNTYGGLVAGNYQVVATQSLGSQTGTQQQNVTILNQIAPLLTYQLVGQNSSTCINNGQIAVNVLSGNAVSYEIFAGPIIRPLQPSNVFTALSAGVYQIRVFDACGEGVVQTFTLLGLPPGLQISNPVSGPATACTTAVASNTLTVPQGFSIAYPLTVVLTLYPPSGGTPIVYNQTITSGNPTTTLLSQNIAMYANQGYTYNLMITDACGNVYIKNNNSVNSNVTPSAQVSPLGCNSNQISISLIQTAILVAAPASYVNPLPFNYNSDIVSNVLVISNVPNGTYTFNVTDICGNPHVLQVNVTPPAPSSPVVLMLPGCSLTTGSVMIISSNGAILSIVMTEAPPAYTVALPQNVFFNVNVNGTNFMMNSLPVGSYKFHIVDSCGNQSDVIVNIQGYQNGINTFALIENCNSFNLSLQHTSNNGYANSFWLQKYNPVNNQWVHPGTGAIYIAGTNLSTLNAVGLTNNGTTINLAYSGHFRIIKQFAIYGNGILNESCFDVLHEFDFDGTPKITDVYSFLCSNNTFQVVVNATGLGPLLYRITTMNGLPFVIQNGTSNIFLGLQPAIYNFQVEDVCGNILNSLHDISNPIGFTITPSVFCTGQPATLSVPNFSFLIYQWWEASAPTVILSTTSQLQFPAFSNSDQGTYFVSIVHLINATCINQTQTYVVNPNQNAPNAGIDGATSFCGSQTTINLFTLLTGNYDTNGTWSAVTPSGTLSSNIWNATGVAAGVYQFKYTVTGFCNAIDEALVTITLKPIPQTPVATANATVCATQPLQLFATTVPNATYQWTGPNNFTSSLQNPILTAATNVNSGVYAVQALLNGCVSGFSSVTVQVVPLPNAGSNGTMSYCGSQNTIDLFTLLNGNYDANGVWSMQSTSGVLTNNIWNATGVGSGVYQFTYTIAGTCSTAVNAFVTITLQPIPQIPTASVNPVVCDSGPLQLFATTIPNATYQWSGPNGFTSTLQNPIINTVSTLNNGTYTLSALQNGCPSGSSSVTVLVAPLPQFTIEFNCIDNRATLTATPIQNSYDEATAIYQWTNADGFSSSDNPVNVTGEAPGAYTLTVTNGGCSNTNSFDVAATLCAIPIGISPNNDGLNDSFDLAGFSGITSVKIFNRYGMVVFEQDNYVKDWIGQDKKGHILPSATYFYLVNFENSEPRTGWVYLLRENN